jgi:hypothetical protein
MPPRLVFLDGNSTPEIAAMKMMKLTMLCAVLCGLSIGSTPTRGDDFDWGAWWRGGRPFVNWSSAYRSGSIPVPPYYAIHPPVYYGVRVTRAYGYSPHANDPPFTMSRSLAFSTAHETILPVTVENPYAMEPTVGSITPPQESPRLVINPFVVPEVANTSSAVTR